MIKDVIVLLKEEKNMDKVKQTIAQLREKAQELLEKVQRDEHSLDVLNRVIVHRYHLPIILEYWRQIHDPDKVQFQEAIVAIQHLFSAMSEEIEQRLLPNNIAQRNLLSRFIETGNITLLVEYIQTYKLERKMLREFKERIQPFLKYIDKAWAIAAAVIKAPARFGEEHIKAVAIFCIAVSLSAFALSLVGPVIPAVVSGLFGVIHSATIIGERLLQIYHVDHAAEVLLTQ